MDTEIILKKWYVTTKEDKSTEQWFTELLEKCKLNPEFWKETAGIIKSELTAKDKRIEELDQELEYQIGLAEERDEACKEWYIRAAELEAENERLTGNYLTLLKESESEVGPIRAYAIDLKAEVERLLNATQLAYRKHWLNDESIGWDELGSILYTAISEVMGDKEFIEWKGGVRGRD